VAAPAILKIDIISDASKLTRDIGKVESTGSRVKSVLKTVGAAVAGAFVVDQVRQMVGAASDLNETINKSQVAFGKSSKEILAWSKTAATSMGLSQQQALESASSFQTMFTQVGLGEKQSLKMSTGIVKLSADLASFHNVSGGAAEVSDMIASAMRGEYDSLQRLIPTINAAKVQQKAMAMTGKTNADQLTDSEKAAATYQLVLEGAGKATGDFARTSGGLANQQRIAQAQWRDLQAQLGNALLPAVTALAKVFNATLLPAIKALANSGLLPWVIGAAAAIWVLNAALDANPIVLIALGVVALVAAIVLLWTNWDRVWTWIMEHKAYAAIIAWFLPMVGAIVGLVAIVKWLASNWDAIWSTIQSVVGAVAGWVQARLDQLGAWLSPWVAIWRAEIGAVIAIFRTLMDAASAVYSWVRDKFSALADAISSVFGGISHTVGLIVNAIKGPINTVLRAWNAIEFKVPEVSVGPFHFGGQTIGLPDIPLLASGGSVLRTGLAIVHRGEQFSGVGRTFGSTTNLTVHVTTTGLGADAPEIQRAVANALRGYTARNGPLDVPTRASA
jgi:hypothetical protein